MKRIDPMNSAHPRHHNHSLNDADAYSAPADSVHAIPEIPLNALFTRLTRQTKWRLVRQVPLHFHNHHAQGMLRIGGLFYLSSVELFELPVRQIGSEGREVRTAGKGQGHLFVFDGEGHLQQDIRLGEGEIYHPGGLDFDGTHLWVPVAEYRPDSRSILYRVDPSTGQASEAFRFSDHIGGLICNPLTGELAGHSWGSRRFYKWTPQGEMRLKRLNGSHLVDYQDGHHTGDGKMIVSGISELAVPDSWAASAYELGGMALIEMDGFQTLHEVPVALFSPEGHVVTRNPVFLESSGGEIRLYAVPDDNRGSLLIYETIGLTQ